MWLISGIKTKKLIIRLGLVLLILAGLTVPAAPGDQGFSEYGNPFIWVKLGQVKVKAEVVASPEKLYLGLGQRRELPAGRGMLFLMPSRVVQTFCMRDMQFPIDILWLQSGRVVGIAKNLPYQDQRACYSSLEPVQYVLEVPAGFCDQQGIKVGTAVSW